MAYAVNFITFHIRTIFIILRIFHVFSKHFVHKNKLSSWGENCESLSVTFNVYFL